MALVPASSRSSAGQQLDYAEITSNASVTATVEASSTTIVSGNAVTFDGNAVVVEFFLPAWQCDTAANDLLIVLFLDGAVNATIMRGDTTGVANLPQTGGVFAKRLTPSAGSHTFSIRGYQAAAGTSTVFAGASGAGNFGPAFIRITRA